MNVVLINLVAQYTKSSLRDIEQAIKLLQAINLTYKEKLYSILIVFLIFCKIRHPDLFIIVKNKWPNLFVLEKGEPNLYMEYIHQHFDKSINISHYIFDDFGRGKTLKASPLIQCVEHMLSQDGRKLPDTYNNNPDSSYSKGLIIEHFQSINGGGYQVNNPPVLKLSHYVQIVEQVGRLT